MPVQNFSFAMFVMEVIADSFCASQLKCTIDSEGNLGNVPIEASEKYEGETIVEGDNNTSSAQKPEIEGNSFSNKAKRIQKLLKNKVHILNISSESSYPCIINILGL